jgi:Dolichyl-phosphate-mannose-protein mannosyltransferase
LNSSTLASADRGGRRFRASLTQPGSLLVLIIILSAFGRLALGAALGLGVDESYMVAAGRDLQLSYFDHPPLSWWMARGASWLAGSEAGLVVRTPFILTFGLTTWFLYRLTAMLFSPRAGLSTVMALNLSPVFGITTGGWVLPDGPLDCALLAGALCLQHAVHADEPNSLGHWTAAALPPASRCCRSILRRSRSAGRCSSC